ncbi:MAG: glutamine amidotransferase [Magnetococcales bacterium]|nr:glutamine amidotransferase [Magnetococcales bacterium]MBF0114316.1 glutamine amidotransferase [Magnetococcales bacterium]
MKNVYAIRHVLFEDMGFFAEVLHNKGYSLHYLEAGVDDLSALDPTAAELLVVLGGPIGVYEEQDYPFILDELRILEQRMAANLPTLGICLGSQLMAKALGARVYPGPAKELGWAPIQLTPEGRDSSLHHLLQQDTHTIPLLHWHGDTFDLPAAATLLATTPAYPQAFSVGPRILALQCHMEVDPRRLETWFIGNTMEINHNHLSVRTLRAETQQHGPALVKQGAAFFAEWLDGF